MRANNEARLENLIGYQLCGGFGMRSKKYWKKIAAAFMATVFFTQGTAALAAEKQADASVQAPVTEAAATEAPVTEAPATEAPVTEAPATEAPVTETPVTEAPATEAPATEAPVTEAPATEAPATEAPVTEAPATEAPVTEAPATEVPATEIQNTETPATESSPVESTESEMPSETLPPETESETSAEAEKETYQTSFRFENEEVLVTASASSAARLPENTQMTVEKLQPGTPAYESAKAMVEAKTGVKQDAEYLFYDVNFFADGQKMNYPEGTVEVQIQFKTEQSASDQEQTVLHIDENAQVENVTAPAAEGSSMSSVKVTF